MGPEFLLDASVRFWGTMHKPEVSWRAQGLSSQLNSGTLSFWGCPPGFWSCSGTCIGSSPLANSVTVPGGRVHLTGVETQAQRGRDILAGTLSYTFSAQAAVSTLRCPQEAGHPSSAELSLEVACSCPSAGGKEEGRTGFRDFPGFPVPGIYIFSNRLSC